MNKVNMSGQIESNNRILKLQVALAIIFSGSAVALSFRGNVALYIQAVLILFVLATIIFKFNWVIKIRKGRASQQCFSVLLVVLVSTLLNFSTFAPTVGGRCVLSVLLAYLIILSFDSGRSAIEAFVSVMRFFAITGFIFWLAFIVVGVPYSWMPTITSSSNSNIAYHTIYIYNILSITDRNCGPFWEPSIYAGYLMLGMVFSRFVLKQDTKLLYPFILALFSTQSSSGTIMLFIFVVLFIWDRNNKNKANKIVVKVLVVLLMVLSLFFWDAIQQFLLQLNYNVFSKIFNAMTDSDSETRLVSFMIDYKIWLESPIWGVGVSNMEVRFLALRDVLSTITDMSHTSTSTEYIAAFGLGGIWINWLWLKGLISKKNSFVLNIGIVMIFFVMLNAAPQINFVLPYFILFALLRIVEENSTIVH